MQVNNILNIKKMVDADGIIFCYSGIVSQGIIEEIGDVVRRKVEMETSLSTTEKVFGIFVEQLTNVMNYSVEKKVHEDKQFGSGIIMVGRETDKFYAACGNLVDRVTKSTIIERLDKIKLLDKQKLKDLYKEQLHSKAGPSGKGAGLGFLDMARKSSEPIVYELQDIDDQNTFFSLKIIV